MRCCGSAPLLELDLSIDDRHTLWVRQRSCVLGASSRAALQCGRSTSAQSSRHAFLTEGTSACPHQPPRLLARVSKCDLHASRSRWEGGSMRNISMVSPKEKSDERLTDPVHQFRHPIPHTQPIPRALRCILAAYPPRLTSPESWKTCRGNGFTPALEIAKCDRLHGRRLGRGGPNSLATRWTSAQEQRNTVPA